MSMTTAPVGEPSPVDLHIPLQGGEPVEQRRWTIALRFILLIPQFIILFFLYIAAFFVLIAGWFAALFTGELPETLRTFLEFFLRWVVRVLCSGSLMTDVYPPFSGEESALFPITITFPEKTPLNRAAVFFRIILVVPAGLLQGFFQAGLAIFWVPFWIAALILGRLPVPVFRMVSTYARFTIRVHTYFSLITACYPWGWKGDLAEPSAQSPFPPAPTTSGLPGEPGSSMGASPGTGLPSYPSPTTSIESGGEGEFDYVLTGWSQAWVWIVLVVGALEELRRNSGGGGAHYHR